MRRAPVQTGSLTEPTFELYVGVVCILHKGTSTQLLLALSRNAPLVKLPSLREMTR